MKKRPEIQAFSGLRRLRPPSFELGRFAGLRTLRILTGHGGVEPLSLPLDRRLLYHLSLCPSLTVGQAGVEPAASHVLSVSGRPVAYRPNYLSHPVPRVGFEPTHTRV